MVNDLQHQLVNLSKQKQLELDNLKSKLAFEIQEREREHVEHIMMIKYLVFVII